MRRGLRYPARVLVARKAGDFGEADDRIHLPGRRLTLSSTRYRPKLGIDLAGKFRQEIELVGTTRRLVR